MHLLLKDYRVLVMAFSNLISNIGINLTFLAIPWYLANTYGDDGEILGVALLISTILIFFISPLFGGLVDIQSKKKLILIQNLVGAIFIGSSATFIVISKAIPLLLIIVIYIFNSVLRVFHYNNLMALNQELFDEEDYSDISSITEIEGQLSVIVSGVTGAYLIISVPIETLFIIDVGTYVIAFVILLFLPYSQNNQYEYKKPSYLKDIMSGIKYCKQNLKPIILLLSLNLPFIVRNLSLLITHYSLLCSNSP